MGHSQRSPLPTRPDPLDTLLSDEHGDGGPTQFAVQSPAKSCKVTASSVVISKILLSTVLWFAVLLYGVLSSRHGTLVQRYCTHACVKDDKTAVTLSNPYLHRNFDYKSVLAEVMSYSAYNSSVLPSTLSASPWTTHSGSPQAVHLHPELALLVDLCPLLQAEPDSYADNCPGYVCVASRYALPCPGQAKYIDPSSLARFILACNKQQTCRSWWLQHQSQHGVCGCAPLMTNLAYSNQHASQAAQKQGLCLPALPAWTAYVWLLIPLGCVATLVHLLMLLQGTICGHLREKSRSENLINACLLAYARNAALLGTALECKAISDVALWLYIYRNEGWSDAVVVMGIIAAVSNLPGSCWNISFAYAAANYYIGLRYILLMILGRDFEWMASWLAITAAVLHFLHNAGLEHTLGKFGLISRRRLQGLTEVAHLGCVLKPFVELSADAPLVVSIVGGGFQYSRMVDVLGSLLLFVLSPAGWMPLAWRVALAINRFLLLSLPKALLRDFWAMQCFWSAFLGLWAWLEEPHRAQRDGLNLESVREQVVRHPDLKMCGFFGKAAKRSLGELKEFFDRHPRFNSERIEACFEETRKPNEEFPGLPRDLMLDMFEPLIEEVLYDTPLAMVTLVVSPLYTFWKIPGWRRKCLAVLDTISAKCCCTCAWSVSWGQAAVTWLGYICGVTLVTSCNTMIHTFKYSQRRAMSAAHILVKDSSIHTYAEQRLWGSVPPSWHRLKGIFSCRRQDITLKASVQKGDQQPGTDAAAHSPWKIKLQPDRVLRFLGSKEDEPATVHLAENQQAATSVHPAAAKHESAALRGDDVQSALLKAHRAKSADPVSHRAASSGLAAEPDQAANGGVKLNKRARREAKKIAKAAATEVESEADIAPVMLIAHDEDDAEAKAEPVKSVAPASPIHDEPQVPALSLTAQDAATAKASAWEEVSHKQDRHSSKEHAAGSGVTEADSAERLNKVAELFKAPDLHHPAGFGRPKKPVGQQECSPQLFAPDGTAAAVAADGAVLASPSQRALPPKPQPHTDRKGKLALTANSAAVGSVQTEAVAATAVDADEGDEDYAGGLCIVCFDAHRSAILAPCGHVAMCTACTEGLLEWKGKDAACPICQRKVESYVAKVYEA